MLPGLANLMVFSGELYIPKTSARASFVLMVTVGSPFIMLFLRAPKSSVRVGLWPSSLYDTRLDEEEELVAARRLLIGSGVHFFPSKPIDLARASAEQYSIPSGVKRREALYFRVSGRFPGAGGANITAYRAAAVAGGLEGADVDGAAASEGV